MKDFSIDKSGKIIYKGIETNFSCENIFNIFSENEDLDLIELLNNEVKEELRDFIIKHLLDKRA
jgi:hypothetical protein